MDGVSVPAYNASMRLKPAACPQCGARIKVLDGRWAREERIRLGLTQREVAKRAGVSAPFICDIEYGRRKFSKATLARFLKALR